MVAHIEIFGKNTLSVGEQVVECISLLPSKGVMVSSFVLHNCRLDEQSPDQLSKLLGKAAEVSELEINETELSPEKVSQIAELVFARNASADSTLTLHIAAKDSMQKIGAKESADLMNKGIHIRNAGQLWPIQLDPVQEAPVQAVPVVEEESSDDDSSSIVGDPSSGDDEWGSEFEYSADESDVTNGS